MPIDPVCGLLVQDGDEAIAEDVRGHRYVFCSEGCRRRFTEPTREHTRLKRLAGIALGLGAVVAVLTHQDLLAAGTHPVLGEPAVGWTLLVLGTVVQFGAGWPFYRQIGEALRAGRANVDTLVALGTTAAWLFSVVEVVAADLLVAGAQQYYFEVSALVLGFLLVGRTIEHRLRRDAGEEAREMMDLQPPDARVLRDGEEVATPVEEVETGDRFVVEADERIPLDGRIVEGTGAVDEKMVTGESLPVDKSPGDKVLGGTLVRSGTFTVEATRVGDETTVSRIVGLMEQARNASPDLQRFADSVTAWYVPLVVAIAAGAFLVWLGLIQVALPVAFSVLIAVLLVGCPCPLGLATPAAVESAVAKGGDRGLLLKGGEFVEALQQVDMVVFDKTGTLTVGRPSLTDVVPIAGDETDLLALAAAVETGSDHPLARTVVNAAREQGLDLPDVDDFEAIAGAGVQGAVDGDRVFVGSPKVVQEADVDLDAVAERLAELQEDGKTAIVVTRSGEVQGVLAFTDALRPEAEQAVARLQTMGIDVGLMTGDHARTARAVGRQLGLGKRRSFAGLTPDDKVGLIHALQDGDRVVAMVGEGINDAPAMARADVGIAMGSGADVAVEAGDIILLQDDLTAVGDAIELGEATLTKIKQNLMWAFTYNVVLIPVAAVGLLQPLWAGILMAFSTIPILVNSARAPSPDEGAPTPADAEPASG